MEWWNWVAYATFVVWVVWKPEVLFTRLPKITFEEAKEQH